jgi:hypothetical protein
MAEIGGRFAEGPDLAGQPSPCRVLGSAIGTALTDDVTAS